MKTIAVVTFTLLSEYPSEVASGILHFFKDKKDFRVVIGQVRSPNNDAGTYSYQFWNVACLFTTEEIDAYIVLSGTFGPYIKEEMDKINPSHKPMVSISKDLGVVDSFYTTTSSRTVYKQIVEHLIKKHNCKKIAYISGNLTGSDEAYERFDSYCNALKENGMEVDEDLIKHGNFTQYYVREIFQKNYKKKEDINFDALICANDPMASASITCLENLGIRIPEDVKVVGFDDAMIARLTTPRLSSVNQSISNQGWVAAELIYKKLLGEEVPYCTEVDLFPVFRQSCGCIERADVRHVHRNVIGELIEEEEKNLKMVGYNSDRLDYAGASALFDIIQSRSTLKRYGTHLSFITQTTRFDNVSIYLFNEVIETAREKDFVKPKIVRLEMFRNRNPEETFSNINYNFDTSKYLFAPKYFENTSGVHMIYPIFSGEFFYGYIIIKVIENNFYFQELAMKIVAHTLAQSVEYTNSQLDNEVLKEKNSDLKQQSRTDELTKIYNRRGFMEYGQRLVNFSTEMGNNGLIFFGDLNGLKGINDKYGHEMGDLAIQTQAKILVESFRQSDIVGRLSGDEFAAVLVGMDETCVNKLKDTIDKNCKKYAKKLKFPFEFSISFGVVEYNLQNFNLRELLSKADEKLYEAKIKFHGEEYYKKEK